MQWILWSKLQWTIDVQLVYLRPTLFSFSNPIGDKCSARKGDLLIEDTQVSHPQLTGRASFSLTLDDSDGFWVLGGYKFSDVDQSNNMFR